MKYILPLLVFLSLWVPSQAQAKQRPLVYFYNNSKEISQAQLDAALPAFQVSIDKALGPVWKVRAVLSTDPSDRLNAIMEVELTDSLNCLCYGYHDVNEGIPKAYIDAQAAELFHNDWRLVASHEIDEMLVDPFLDRTLVYDHKSWIVEICDPVPTGNLAYFVNGIPMSDFIKPNWFKKNSYAQDYTHYLSHAGQLYRDGYLSWRSSIFDDWHLAENMYRLP